MMKSKLFAIATALTVCLPLVNSGFSEEPAPSDKPECHRDGRYKHHKGNRGEFLADALDLTADQKAKMDPVFKDAQKQIKAIHEEAKAKAKAIMDQAEAQLRPLLTPEQVKKLDGLHALRDARKKQHEKEEKEDSE